MNIIELENAVKETNEAIAAENKRHDEALSNYKWKLEKYAKMKYAIMNSLDNEAIQTAKKYIETRGMVKHFYGDASQALYDCILDCSNGFKKLKNEYFGCKNYDRWSGQRCDCDYGYGPSHGSIVFEIGLRDHGKGAENISESDACAIVYYLNLLKDPVHRKGLLFEHE